MHFISAVVQVTGVIVHPDGQIISCALDKYATQHTMTCAQCVACDKTLCMSLTSWVLTFVHVTRALQRDFMAAVF